MSMRKGSRYEGLKLYVYKDEKGRTRKCLDFRPPVTLKTLTSEAKIHTVRLTHGDWLDVLAIKNGANREELWYLIADVNAVEAPLDIEGGTALYIPPAAQFLRF